MKTFSIDRGHLIKPTLFPRGIGLPCYINEIPKCLRVVIDGKEVAYSIRCEDTENWLDVTDCRSDEQRRGNKGCMEVFLDGDAVKDGDVCEVILYPHIEHYSQRSISKVQVLLLDSKIE